MAPRLWASPAAPCDAPSLLASDSQARANTASRGRGCPFVLGSLCFCPHRRCWQTPLQRMSREERVGRLCLDDLVQELAGPQV